MGKLVPSPTVTSKVAAVLTAIPGIEVRTFERGCASSRALIWRFCGPALFVDGAERAGQGGDHDVEGAGGRDDDGLLVEGVEDLVDQPGGHARGLGPDDLNELAASGLSQASRGSVAFQQPGDGLVVQARPEDAFQRRVELGEQTAVGGRCASIRRPAG
ncbi:hypothetical protein ASD08_11095 [Streptomyces sp. Root369]|nr:hypothetical protein ASD08_11095 [Streptomyces sp. Root369]